MHDMLHYCNRVTYSLSLLSAQILDLKSSANSNFVVRVHVGRPRAGHGGAGAVPSGAVGQGAVGVLTKVSRIGIRVQSELLYPMVPESCLVITQSNNMDIFSLF